MYQQKKETADEEVGYILEIWLFVRSVTRPCGGSYISKHVVRNGGEDESGLSVLHVKQKRLEQRARENTGKKKVVGATDGKEDEVKRGCAMELALLGKMPDKLRPVRRVHTYVSVVIAASSAVFRARCTVRRGQEAHYSYKLPRRSTATRRKTKNKQPSRLTFWCFD